MDNTQNDDSEPNILDPPKIPSYQFTIYNINDGIKKINKYINILTDGDVDEHKAYQADLQDLLQVKQSSDVNADNNESMINELKSFKHMITFKRLLNDDIDINVINDYLLSLSDYINKAIQYLNYDIKAKEEGLKLFKEKNEEKNKQIIHRMVIKANKLLKGDKYNDKSHETAEEDKSHETAEEFGIIGIKVSSTTIVDLTKIKTDVDNLIKGIKLVNHSQLSATTASQFPNLNSLMNNRSANTAGGAVALKVKRIKRKTRRSTKSRRKSFHKKTNRRRDSRR
jgi:hypothetical protein